MPLLKDMQRYIPPLTFLKCSNCGTENSRPFQEDDYIFKKTNEKCPRCGGNEMLIVNIYVKEKKEESR